MTLDGFNRVFSLLRNGRGRTISLQELNRDVVSDAGHSEKSLLVQHKQ